MSSYDTFWKIAFENGMAFAKRVKTFGVFFDDQSMVGSTSSY